jgi:hypothetical protein
MLEIRQLNFRALSDFVNRQILIKSSSNNLVLPKLEDAYTSSYAALVLKMAKPAECQCAISIQQKATRADVQFLMLN